MKIAFYGDVVGEIGINGVKNNIIGQSYDFIVANGENTNDTHGMTNEQWCELCDKWQPLF